MHHRPHVGAVDAHAEGVGGDRDVEFAGHERTLHALAHRAAEARVVGRRAPAEGREARRLLVGGLARGRVDDGRAPRVVGRAEGFGQHRVHPAPALGPGPHFRRAQGQVRPGEAADDLRGGGIEAEALKDLVPHDRRRGGGAGEHPGFGMIAQEVPDLEVVRAKVVTPLADAVCFVHRDERRSELLQQGAKPRIREPLRRGVDELVLLPGEPGQAIPHGGGIEGGGKERGRHPPRLEGLDLVLHERDQRGDDERGAG